MLFAHSLTTAALSDSENDAFESAHSKNPKVITASMAATAAARQAGRHNELAAVDEATIQRYGIAASGPWDVAAALVVQDLIGARQFKTLTRAWRETIGELPPGLRS